MQVKCMSGLIFFSLNMQETQIKLFLYGNDYYMSRDHREDTYIRSLLRGIHGVGSTQTVAMEQKN